MKSRVVAGALAAVLLLAIGWRVVAVRRARQAPVEETKATVPVEVAKVERADVTESIIVTGTIRPRNEVDVYAKVPGRIEELTVQVGDKVKAGQLLAQVEHNEIAWQAKAADAAVQLARAQLQGARLELDRTIALAKGGAAPQAQLDGAKIKATLAEAQVAQAEASAGLANQHLKNARIEAAIAGVVTRKLVNLGAQVGPQLPLFTIQDLDALKLETSVDASDVARLKKGQGVQVSVDALPGKTFDGQVSVVSPALDAATRRAMIEVQVSNPDGLLLPQMFATAAIAVGKSEQALTVPRLAVRSSGEGEVVYVVKDGIAREVRPELGPSDGQRTVVRSGLSEGDLVATTGVGALSDNAAVTVLSKSEAQR